jgi:hypothetical protein
MVARHGVTQALRSGCRLEWLKKKGGRELERVDDPSARPLDRLNLPVSKPKAAAALAFSWLGQSQRFGPIPHRFGDCFEFAERSVVNQLMPTNLNRWH